MRNAERSIAPERIALNPLAVGLLTAAVTMAPMAPDSETSTHHVDQNSAHTLILNPENRSQATQEILEREPGQLFGTFVYGHRERNMIMQNGDIADGFQPVNGIEYGEEDVKLIFEQLKQFKYSNIDFGIYSWHSIDDVRDKYLNFMLEVLRRPDNPHPNFKITDIYEIDSNKSQVPQETLEKDLLHHQEHFFNDPNFLKDEEGRPIMVVFSQYLEGIIDNPAHAQQWYEAGEKFGFTPILEAYFGDTLNPYNDRLKWYQYADEIWDLRPTGLHITRDVARVNVAYSKPGDIKEIPYDGKKFESNLKKAVRSGKMVVVVSWNEYWENTDAEGRPEAQEIMHDVFPAQPFVPRAASGDQFINIVQDYIDNQKDIVPPTNLPPARPKENILYAITERARKRNDDEFDLAA